MEIFPGNSNNFRDLEGMPQDTMFENSPSTQPTVIFPP